MMLRRLWRWWWQPDKYRIERQRHIDQLEREVFPEYFEPEPVPEPPYVPFHDLVRDKRFRHGFILEAKKRPEAWAPAQSVSAYSFHPGAIWPVESTNFVQVIRAYAPRD